MKKKDKKKKPEDFAKPYTTRKDSGVLPLDFAADQFEKSSLGAREAIIEEMSEEDYISSEGASD